MATATQNKTAIKFRDMADRLQVVIDRKRAGSLENTPKRQKEGACRRIEADHADRVRRALLSLADGHERGNLPEPLSSIKSKIDLEGMLRTVLDTSGGYYSIRDTGEFRDTSPRAVMLRKFIDSQLSDGEFAQIAAQKERDKITELEADLKFRNIPGFFPTPGDIIDHMIELAGIRLPHSFLEPSAGKGDILDRVRGLIAEVPAYCEISNSLIDVLKAKGYGEPIKRDFMNMDDTVKFARIIMNPPFERGQDIQHIRKAHDLLLPGGRLVSVCSTGPFFRSDKASVAFRAWLDEIGAEIEDLPDGSFKSAFCATGVSAKLVTITKD